MPKKFKGENTKASSARERKAVKANEERAAREKMIEDAQWKDDDKTIAKKNMRKEEKDKKAQELLEKKLEKKKLLEEEEADIGKSKPAVKVTRYDISEKKAAELALAEKAAEEAAMAKKNISLLDGSLLMENTNKMEDIASASGVDDAIKALSVESSTPVMKNGRVRVNMAAAYKKFEANRLPSMKKENPTLKQTQLIQRIKKEWQKSPENPMNQLT